jgi:hypothetical protein
MVLRHWKPGPGSRSQEPGIHGNLPQNKKEKIYLNLGRRRTAGNDWI